MKRKPRTVMIVPPNGARVRTIRVRGAAVVLATVLVAAGFSGYVIPFNRFAVDRVKLNEKRNLERINQDLLYRVVAIRKILGDVKGHVGELSGQGAKVKLGGVGAAGPGRDAARESNVAALGIGELASLVSTYEKSWRALVARMESQSTLFADLPVLVPVRAKPVLSAPFGRREDPFTGLTKWHTGVDLVGPRGVPVVATARGTVAEVNNGRRWGLVVRIEHAHGLSTTYAHLGSVSVSHGQRVSRGQVIGTLGSTGLTTGPHLHYEIRRNGAAVDPEGFFFPAYDSLIVRPMPVAAP